LLDLDIYDEQALRDRLTNGLNRSEKQVVFLVGSALTAPPSPSALGVPGVEGIIDLIKTEFDDQQADELDRSLQSSTNPYQDAFHFLLGRRGPQAANGIIRAAMSQARLPIYTSGALNTYKLSAYTDESTCRFFDGDKAGWSLSPGVQALGELAVQYPDRFGQTILTTNFDPLIEVAVAVAGGGYYRTVLHRDGNLGQTEGAGAHIIHLHGYWYGSDTLHTPRQLGQARPQLKASLAHLIRNKIVVVMAYGGWDDAFTDALVEVVMDDNAYPEVVWTFFSESPKIRPSLFNRLEPGLSRARVMLYGGINCHMFLPALVNWWQDCHTPAATCARGEVPVSESIFVPQVVEESQTVQAKFLGEQLPPNIDFYVGRVEDLKILSDHSFKVGFVTGMGGQGKSALAGAYFALPTTAEEFDHRLWRDCKEESDKFEDQIAKILEALAGGRTIASELAIQPIEDLAELFVNLTKNLKLLIVFDNIDQYVDLEATTLTGAAGRFIARLLAQDSGSKLLFTCRPPIRYADFRIVSHRLKGLEKQDARELFRLRRASATEAEIDRAHSLTGGHAFWLDILAAQVAKHAPRIQLVDLLQSISSGRAELPEATLKSIWNNLPDREKIVLQGLAEALRPTTALQLADYLGSRLRYNQMSKALRSLRDINLIVSRPLNGSEEGLELHPLIRAFILKTFPISERITFIDAILNVYGAFFVAHRTKTGTSKSPMTVNQWIEGAELSVNAGRYENAIDLLDEIQHLFKRSEPPGEFLRVCSQLFSSVKIAKLAKLKRFEMVFETYVNLLAKLARTSEAIDALERYRDTLSGKEARYIHYCDMLCYLHWINGNYSAAIKWGAEGAKLKSDTGVDTVYSTDHNFALAQRDSGAIDQALAYFSEGVSINDVTDSATLDKEKGGAFYGNIGRCFQLMGQVEPALGCYRKSAFLIEEDQDDFVENQAYIRQWIGELLLIKGEKGTALLFMCAARAKWAWVSPPRADRVAVFIQQNFGSVKSNPSPSSIEKFYIEWIRAPYS
jgi:tetratricopeptide (TPR) repeat protein